MWQEASKYLGRAYVWGGSSPSTGFDCSGFVCWVINQSGVGHIGRTTAEGIRQWCDTIPKSERQPGDIIFFQGTYDTPGASHVGIYIGDGKMIHCGIRSRYPTWTAGILPSTSSAMGGSRSSKKRTSQQAKVNKQTGRAETASSGFFMEASYVRTIG